MTTIWFVTCVAVALAVGAILGKKSSRSGRFESTVSNKANPNVDAITKVVD